MGISILPTPKICRWAWRFENGALANWMLSMAGRGEGYFHRAIYGTSGSLIIPEDFGPTASPS